MIGIIYINSRLLMEIALKGFIDLISLFGIGE